MTGLLVSVRDAGEATAALAGGADLIDVKEPLAGSLGAASPDAVAGVVQAVAGRRPTSIALGELRDNASWSSYAARLTPSILPKFVKFGLAGCWPPPDKSMPTQSHGHGTQRSPLAHCQADLLTRETESLLGLWRAALAPLPVSIGAVAVVYADWQVAESPPPEIVLLGARELKCHAMLVDTFDKRGPGLLGVWSSAQLADCVRAARDAGLLVVLGGKIREEHLDRLMSLEPDFIAVRGAVCRGDRSGTLDPRRIEEFRARLMRIASGAAFASPAKLRSGA